MQRPTKLAPEDCDLPKTHPAQSEAESSTNHIKMATGKWSDARARTHTHTHARTHARTHAHTHTRMYHLFLLPAKESDVTDRTGPTRTSQGTPRSEKGIGP